MDGLDGLVRQYVNKAEMIATKAEMDESFRLMGAVSDWHADLREQAHTLPAGQGDILLSHTAGQLKMMAGNLGPGTRQKALQLCAMKAQGGTTPTQAG